jgi:ethanolamine utilization protein EutP
MQDHQNLIIDRTHAFMLMGPVGAGKSTLFNALFKRDSEAQKTQAVEYETDLGVDTPGEFFSHPRLYHALINTAADVGTLVYVHAADDFNCRMPPGLMQIYEGKHLIAVLTKTDLPEANAAQVAAMLRENGIKGPIFFTSIKQPESIAPLRQKLLEYQQEAESVRAREVC